MTIWLAIAAAAANIPAWNPVHMDEMRHYAACIASRDPVLSRRYASSTPGSSEEGDLGRRLARYHYDCLQLRGITTMAGDIVHGMVADALLRRSPNLLSAVEARSEVPARRPSEGLSAGAFLNGYAACLVDASPVRAAAVLRTAPGSEDEGKAIMRFSGLLMDCMPTDIAYHLNRTELRAHLAIAAYRSLPQDKV